MTIVVAYAPRPEGLAALEKAIEIAKRRNENLVVVNASPGGSKADAAMVGTTEAEHVEKLLADSGVDAEFKRFVRGKNAVEEIKALVESLPTSLLIIGLRRRSAVGKLVLGSVAQELLLSVACPVLAVKAN